LSDPIAVFCRSRVVEARDLDALDHVNNVVWVRFVVELANAHSCAVDLDLDTLRSLGGVWVVQRHELDYHRAASLGDEIEEATWVSEMRGARCLRHASLRLARDGTLLLGATTHWAFVDPKSGRPRRVPREVSSRFPLHPEPTPDP
jgi:acyl-CoA thioester hydrolase